MAKTGTPALERGTPAAEEFAALCRLGWSDTKIAAHFDVSWMTARKYRGVFAPDTVRRKKMPLVAENNAGAVSVGTEGPQGTPDAEGRGNKEVA